jgi:O-methyltransferase
MNRVKLLAPDFVVGKVLVMLRALLNIGTLVLLHPSKRSFNLARLILRVKPTYTMVTSKNLISLYNIVQKADALDLPGDIVECGVWNGGSSALMGVAHRDGKTPKPARAMWLFDSFQGLPPPSAKDGAAEQKHYFEGLNKGAMDNVQKIFRRLHVALDNVHIVPGWFNQTLPNALINNIAVLHIDADWYDSVKIVLDTLYDRVVPGGFIILDDYGYWEGCERALNDYFVEHAIKNVVIQRADHIGAFFQKPLPVA